MSKFEWMELETLSSEIAHSQSRLDAARRTKNHGLVNLLQREIAEAAERRARVLADITKGLGVVGHARSASSPVQMQKIEPQEARGAQQQDEQVVALTGTALASSEPTLSPDPTKGVDTVWDKLTRADVERVKQGLSTLLPPAANPSLGLLYLMSRSSDRAPKPPSPIKCCIARIRVMARIIRED
jgi:hypothetical protein